MDEALYQQQRTFIGRWTCRTCFGEIGAVQTQSGWWQAQLPQACASTERCTGEVIALAEKTDGTA